LKLCLDEGGSSFGAANAIRWNLAVSANKAMEPIQFYEEHGIPMGAADNIGAASTATGDITLMILGKESKV
jgi:hypothetical protein